MIPPVFDADFLARLEDLILWRRDVRHFKPDPIPEDVILDLLTLATRAPSVGNAQPWRFVMIESPDRRAAVRAIFERCNRAALDSYEGEKARLYASLKLSGLDDAPVRIAAFVETAPEEGHGLGRATMPETLRDSVAFSLQTLCLAARARGIGVGMVSIIDPQAVARELDVPKTWSLVSLLCVGYPVEQSPEPELERLGWQDRLDVARTILRR